MIARVIYNKVVGAKLVKSYTVYYIIVQHFLCLQSDDAAEFIGFDDDETHIHDTKMLSIGKSHIRL